MLKDNTKIATLTKDLSRTAQSIIGDNLRKIIVYGSYARGDYKDHSDIDIMILADISEQDCKSVENKIDEVASDLGLEHDIIVSVLINNETLFLKRSSISPFYRNILSEGVEIYGTRQRYEKIKRYNIF